MRVFTISLLLLFASLAALRAEEKSEIQYLREELAKTQEQKAVAESQVASLRSELVSQALQIKHRVKEAELKDAQKLQDETAALAKQTQQEQSLRRWAVADFEDARYGRLPEARTSFYMKRLQKAKQVTTRMLLEFPEQSRLAVTNGNALNVFLELCGKAALNHQQFRAEFDKLEGLGHRVGGKRVLRREDVERLQFQMGPRKTGMIFDAKRGALTLDWPPLLSADGKYTQHLRMLEKAKAKALASLREGHPVDWLTQSEMYTAADKICELFNKQYRDFQAGWIGGRGDAQQASEHMAAEQFVHGLRSDIAQFVQARTLKDVQCDELFDGQDGLFAKVPAGGGIAVEDLMAFMVKRGMRFARAKSNDEQVYKTLYDLSVDYYTDLNSIQVAMDTAESKLEDMERYARQRLQEARWDPVRDAIAALDARPPTGFLDAMMMYQRSVSRLGEAMQEQRAAKSEKAAKPAPRWYEFEIRERVSNNGFQIWWRGNVVERGADKYRVELFYVRPDFASKWRVGTIYDFREGQMKRLP